MSPARLQLGYMPHRDDFEDFDKETENLVAQIADKSVEDEDLDIALKLAQCDIYERRLREQVGFEVGPISRVSILAEKLSEHFLPQNYLQKFHSHGTNAQIILLVPMCFSEKCSPVIKSQFFTFRKYILLVVQYTC
jgi:hypothetical protein